MTLNFVEATTILVVCFLYKQYSKYLKVLMYFQSYTMNRAILAFKAVNFVFVCPAETFA